MLNFQGVAPHLLGKIHENPWLQIAQGSNSSPPLVYLVIGLPKKVGTKDVITQNYFKGDLHPIEKGEL